MFVIAVKIFWLNRLKSIRVQDLYTQKNLISSVVIRDAAWPGSGMASAI